jgi:serine-aspartate repeat-containing protein C/D/E
LEENMKLPSALKTLLLVLILVISLTLPAYASATSVSGYAFVDINLDGLPTDNERRVDNMEVALYLVEGGNERLVASAITGKDGFYQFDQLPPGEYVLTAALPKGFVFGPYDPSGSAMLPAAGRASRSLPFRLEGQPVVKNIGATAKSTYISVVAFGDENMNGGRFSSEPLIRDVLIEVLFELDGTSHVIGSGTTGKDGTVKIGDLTPGTYRIAATMPSPYIIGPLGAKVSAFYNVVNPSESNRGESNPFTVTGSIGLGVGGVKSGTLRGSTWFDQNMNGIMDAGESGASGLVLTLTNPALGVTRTLTADTQTEYEFSQLQAGDYVLTATLPEGQMFTLPGGDSLFSDGFALQQEVRQNVAEGLTAVLAPIGVMPVTSLEVIAFHDTNFNGVRDEGEPPFSGADISVMEKGKAIASTQTDAQGVGLIPRVRGGSLSLRAQLPADQVFSVAGGEGGNVFSSLTASSDITIEANAAHGEKTTLLAGVTLPGTITGSLFEDNNTSGILDQDEGMLPGFSVEAIDISGNVAAQAITNEVGAFELAPLLPGDYRVRVMLQSPYIFSGPSQTGADTENKITSQTPEYGETEVISLSPGQRVDSIDAGAFKSGVVNGQVLLGDERDGFDGTLGGLPGVLVELTDENSIPVSDFTIAKTDETGAFSLKGALPGTYKLRYTLPEHAMFSQPMRDETVWMTEPFNISAGEVRAQEPVFVVKTAIFSGSAFHDVNFNGVEDEGDSKLPGVQIILLKDGNTANEAATDENGGFILGRIPPGAYTLEVILPEGLAVGSSEHSPVFPSISGHATAEVDFAMGDVKEDNLIAAVTPISVSGSAFYDNNTNGVFDPDSDIPYAAQALIRHAATGAEYNLDIADSGSFALPAIFPGEYELIATLPEDRLLTLPQGANREGDQWRVTVSLSDENPQLYLGFVQYGEITGAVWNMDGSATSIDGLVITLKNESGVAVATATTAQDGSFAFDKLYPGVYTLTSQLPEHYRFARTMDTAQRASLITSDSSPTRGDSSPISLAMGEKKAGQDIGIGAVGKLGDMAWLDLNGNGMQDAGEPGVPDIGIALYQYDQLITQTTTDAYGRYLLSDLFPGTYTVVVTMPPELKPTIVQTQFPLVGSVILPAQNNAGRADNILVPSGGRNLSCDFGFVLVTPGRLPASMQNLPVKDWSPVVDIEPKR